VRRRTKLFLALGTILALPAVARADVIVITAGAGGSVHGHRDYYRQLATSGHRIVVDGYCKSACTELFGYFPRNRVCVTPRARFGFHLSYEPLLSYAPLGLSLGHGPASADGTKVMTHGYPPVVWAWLRAHGGLTAEYKWMPAADLRGYFAYCSPNR
jgi:hypothetical protein